MRLEREDDPPFRAFHALSVAIPFRASPVVLSLATASRHANTGEPIAS